MVGEPGHWKEITPEDRKKFDGEFERIRGHLLSTLEGGADEDPAGIAPAVMN